MADSGLEPCNNVDTGQALTSIAISLKRIADAVDPKRSTFPFGPAETALGVMRQSQHYFANAVMRALEDSLARAIEEGIKRGLGG